MFPFEIQFRDMDPSDFIHNAIFEHAEKLQRYFDRIVSGHVIVSAPHRNQAKGKIYRIQIHLEVPGSDIHVNREPELDGAHEDIYVCIRDAFAAATRQLEDHASRLRGEGKHHDNGHGVGRVERIFSNDGYGFLQTTGGREIYFHENALLNCDISEVKVGDLMEFTEEMGDKGPQASSLKRV